MTRRRSAATVVLLLALAAAAAAARPSAAWRAVPGATCDARSCFVPALPLRPGTAMTVGGTVYAFETDPEKAGAAWEAGRYEPIAFRVTRAGRAQVFTVVHLSRQSPATCDVRYCPVAIGRVFQVEAPPVLIYPRPRAAMLDVASPGGDARLVNLDRLAARAAAHPRSCRHDLLVARGVLADPDAVARAAEALCRG